MASIQPRLLLSCRFCQFSTKSVDGYVNHCGLHKNECNNAFPCPLVPCSRRFTTFSAFKSHVLRDHVSPCISSVKGNVMSIRCQLAFCDEVVNGMDDFIKHLKEHMNVGTRVECPFEGCSRTYALTSTFTSHLSRKHSKRILSVDYIHVQPNPVSVPASVPEVREDNPEAEMPQLIENMDETSDDENSFLKSNEFSSLYLRNLALFFLKLESKLTVPVTTVQSIVDELQDVHRIGKMAMNHKLIEMLTDRHGFSLDDAKSLALDLEKEDLLSTTCQSFLNTNHFRQKTYKQLFNYVAPVCSVLGRNDANTEKSSYYVPIKESLKSLFRNESVVLEYKIPGDDPCTDQEFCKT